MEIRARRRPVRAAPLLEEEEEVEDEAHDVQLYRRPPLHSVALLQLETAALDRVRALRVLEAAGARGLRPGSAEWRSAALAGLQGAGLADYLRSARAPGSGGGPDRRRARAADRLAHFALRLACCRAESTRRWFVTHELELFRLRFAALSPSAVQALLASARLPLRPLDRDELLRLRAPLLASTAAGTPAEAPGDVYRVRFRLVPELVRTRRVLVRDGDAFVPAAELGAVLAAQLRARLGHALALAARHLPRLEADPRLVPLLRGLLSSDSDNVAEAESPLPLATIDRASVESFAPCMRHLHERLRAAHHLKHGGRLQYGLFLKAAGLTLEDAMKFWREEFTKLIDDDKFDKIYAYNVRYNYGKEGSKKNYSAYSCSKIIQGNVGPGDSHGCPFRHSDASILNEKLKSHGIPPADAAAILDLVKRGHYQLACGKYFDGKHGVSAELGINHPNQYFAESRKILAGDFRAVVPENRPADDVVPVDVTATEADEWGDDFDVSLVEADEP